MTEVKFLPPAARFLKKLKDKNLKLLFREAIDKIREVHTIGEVKSGDLTGIYCYDIFYNKTNYELAYMPLYVDEKRLSAFAWSFFLISGNLTKELIFMRKVLFTSDLHFGHENIINFDNRPFSAADETDAELIRRWNNKVSPGDLVYVLGDII